MEVLHVRCAGLDVHKDTVVACVRCVSAPKHHEVRTFGTTTRELLKLADWLESHGCTHIAMEATGVYWKPVWHVLEERFELVLANAQHIRNVPGQKTDVNDAMWIADSTGSRACPIELRPTGENSGAARPHADAQAAGARDLPAHAPYPKNARGRQHQSLQCPFERPRDERPGDAGCDHRGRRRSRDLGGSCGWHGPGASEPHSSRRYVDGSPLTTARMLQLHLDIITSIEAALDRRRWQPRERSSSRFERAPRCLTTMPGVSDIVANVIVAEIGVDMSRFPTAGHLVSWAGLCPRNDERCRKATIHPRAKKRELAEDDTGHSSMGGGP